MNNSPVIIAIFVAGFFTSKPKRNKPRIPPLNNDANAHQTSNALLTPKNSIAALVLKIAITTEAMRKKDNDFSSSCGQKSANSKVAELLILVESVLIPADKMAATNNPLIPVGSAVEMK